MSEIEFGERPNWIKQIEEKLKKAEQSIEKIGGLERVGKFITIKNKKEHLSRAKKVIDDSWVYGFFTLYERIENDIRSVIVFLDKDNEFNVHQIYKTTVGDFTGLCDKDGKKIFEGDIVKDCENGIYVVVYDHEFMRFAFLQEKIAWGMECFDSICDFEVIGNIYDNPELLEDVRSENE